MSTNLPSRPFEKREGGGGDLSLRSSSPFESRYEGMIRGPNENVTFIKGSCKYLSRRKQYSSLFEAEAMQIYARHGTKGRGGGGGTEKD